jgi:hypothetical protein
VKADGSRSRAVSEQRHVVRITAKTGNVFLHPTESLTLIEKTHVSSHVTVTVSGVKKPCRQ